jgi:hypothetical protein
MLVLVATKAENQTSKRLEDRDPEATNSSIQVSGEII